MNLSTYQAFSDPDIQDNSKVYSVSGTSNQLKSTNEDLNWDIKEVQNSFKKLCKSLVNVQRDLCVIDELSHILELLHDSIEKLKIECYRVGAISKSTKIQIPSSANLSAKFSLQQISLALKTLHALVTSLASFIEKYKSEPFNLFCYLNMNRIGKSERLLKQAHEKIKSLEKFSYLLRFHSIGLIFVIAVRWVRKFRGIKLRINETMNFEEDGIFRYKRNLPNINVSNIDESVQEALFTKTNEDRPQTLWPVSPITSFVLDVSLNSSVGSFVSNLPKTVFTPDNFSVRPKKSNESQKKKKGK
ncbi:unnamed protein product [Blepharisma stoltei]|uniref:Uncharacterized protein n=1 Tax=Blepharisma stoltei TaxID=1481888 RepID=A0AAU9ICM3_9CILI|nr:unnamed protein product [Blepharisma stoltei]